MGTGGGHNDSNRGGAFTKSSTLENINSQPKRMHLSCEEGVYVGDLTKSYNIYTSRCPRKFPINVKAYLESRVTV